MGGSRVRWRRRRACYRPPFGADEGTIRHGIHRFDETGMASWEPLVGGWPPPGSGLTAPRATRSAGQNYINLIVSWAALPVL